MRIRYSTDANGKPIKKAIVYTAKEHGIDKRAVDQDAQKIVARLRAHGHKAYIVGGAVRDLILGKNPTDFDLATDASPNRLRRLFRNARIIGKRFRLVHIFFGPKIIEVSTFRSLENGTTGNSFGTIDDDVLRRDFTCNALYYEPEENIVIDYVGGVEDLRKRRLRLVIDRKRIFIEDPVRMLRAIKYAHKAELSLPYFLKRQIRREAPLLQEASSSRLGEELSKIFFSGLAEPVFRTCIDFNVYRYLQPCLADYIEDNRNIAEKFFTALKNIDLLFKEEATPDPVEVFTLLIENYVKTIIDWSPEKPFSFRDLVRQTRAFIFPLSPQRVHLEKALRNIAIAQGVPAGLLWVRGRRRPRTSK